MLAPDESAGLQRSRRGIIQAGDRPGEKVAK
jgi:hypothetical protein